MQESVGQCTWPPSEELSTPVNALIRALDIANDTQRSGHLRYVACTATVATPSSKPLQCSTRYFSDATSTGDVH